MLSGARLLERVLEPALVLVVDEAVGEDALALVLPPGGREVGKLLVIGVNSMHARGEVELCTLRLSRVER